AADDVIHRLGARVGGDRSGHGPTRGVQGCVSKNSHVFCSTGILPVSSRGTGETPVATPVPSQTRSSLHPSCSASLREPSSFLRGSIASRHREGSSFPV